MNGATVHSIDEAKLEHARAYIDKHRRRRQSNKVLHGHPSPLFWLERDVPVGEMLHRRRVVQRSVPKRTNVYVATPYCLPTDPDRCGFCLFPSEVYQGREQLDRYLTYLDREGQMYRDLLGDSEVGTIYFGGGTSNLYRAEHYATLLGIVRRVFGALPPDIEITLEGIPQLFSREKLTGMKAAGINRVSIGVQQLDDEMIKLSGRKQKAAQVFQTLEWCEVLGLSSSVDLIFGWPRQTIELMLADLTKVVAAGVPHITHYELNVAGRTDFARHRRSELPSTETNLEMYRIGRDFLRSHGYRQLTAYDWAKADRATGVNCLYEETGHVPLTSTPDGRVSGCDSWGWGFAGVSFFYGTPDEPGWATMNSPHVDDYFARLDGGAFPPERGFHYTAKDLRLTVLLQMLHTMTVDLADYRRVFGVDLIEEHAEIWQAFGELGWLSLTPDRLTLVGDGVFYTPLLHGLLTLERMDELRRARPRIELVEDPV
jgi:oxygen-independent coproporphyrinogen-3 oxidase